MKESKFIELLNLYIDQQILPEDAALLEEEILQNPRRRQIYSQYCRMHRACSLALERQEARTGTEPMPARVLAFETRRRPRWAYYAGGLAAAACVTFVAVQTFLRSGASATPHAVATAQHAPGFARTATAPAAVAVRLDAPVTPALPKTEGYIVQRPRLAAPMTGTPGGMFLAGPESENARISLPMAPATALRTIPRPSIEDFVFSHDPATPDDPNVFRTRQPGGEQVENMALEFQRQ
jgi:hypothetical protein